MAQLRSAVCVKRLHDPRMVWVTSFFQNLMAGSNEILFWGFVNLNIMVAQWCGRCVLIMHLAVPFGMSNLSTDTVACGSAKRTCQKVKTVCMQEVFLFLPTSIGIKPCISKMLQFIMQKPFSWVVTSKRNLTIQNSFEPVITLFSLILGIF